VADARPDLDAAFDAFAVEATVTLPMGGFAPTVVVTQAVEIGPFITPFPADSGNWSMTKSRRRFALRLAPLGVKEVPFGTEIAMAGLTVTVEGTDYSDNEVAYVLVR